MAQIGAARETPPAAYGNLRGPDKAANACTHTGWTDHRIDLLKVLWQDGLSASQIAKQLKGVTRNAVIGKVKRLGLTGRDAPYKPGAPAKPKAVRAPAARKLRIHSRGTFEEAEARPPRAVVSLREEAPGLRTVLTICRCECRWPIGDPREPEFTFCGQPAPEGRPYCGPHHRRAVATVQPGPKPRPYVARGA